MYNENNTNRSDHINHKNDGNAKRHCVQCNKMLNVQAHDKNMYNANNINISDLVDGKVDGKEKDTIINVTMALQYRNTMQN